MKKYSQQEINRLSVITRHRLFHQLIKSFDNVYVDDEKITTKNLAKLTIGMNNKAVNTVYIISYGTDK